MSRDTFTKICVIWIVLFAYDFLTENHQHIFTNFLKFSNNIDTVDVSREMAYFFVRFTS